MRSPVWCVSLIMHSLSGDISLHCLMPQATILPYANIDWDQHLPRSQHYGDGYYGRDDGLAESRHVFLAGNKLHERWKQWSRPHFVIGETGFGSGLNFLAAWQLWREIAPKQARLHMVSVELHPMQPQDMRRALSAWPELTPLTDTLLADYPPPFPGYHRLIFDGGRIVLTLMFGDATSMWQESTAHVDAWFLDGFAPSGNPGMWQPDLFDAMAARSHAETTLATFTVARRVRDGLQSAGFTTSKATGFGRKRDMLCGEYHGAAYQPPASPSEVTIAGAGLAGIAAAHALAQRNIASTVMDPNGTDGGASANPAAVMMPYFTADWSARGRFYANSYWFSRNQMRHLPADMAQRCGILELPVEEKIRERQRKYLSLNIPDTVLRPVSATEATHHAGIALSSDGLWYPEAGWVSLQAWRDHMMACWSNHIQLVTQPLDDKACAQGHTVILATSGQLPEGLPSLPIKALRGQATRFASTSHSSRLSCVLHYGGYVTPAIHGHHICGSTYDRNQNQAHITEEDNRQNLSRLHRAVPVLIESTTDTLLPQVKGWAALRGTSAHHLPLIGSWQLHHPASLYTSLAHGSRGSLSCALAGELLASLICGEPLPVEQSVLAALLPKDLADVSTTVS